MATREATIRRVRPARRWRAMAALTLIATAIVTDQACAATTTVWVDASSHGGPCSDLRSATEAQSPQTPWCSLDHAVTAAPADTIVKVRGGSYPKLSVGARSDPGWLHLQAAPDEQVSLAGANLTSASNITLEGFLISGGVGMAGGSNIVLRRNAFDVATGGAIGLSLGATGVSIEDNLIHTPTGTAINVSGAGTAPPVSDLVIKGNHITGVGRDAMQLKKFSDVVVEGNEIDGVVRMDMTIHPDVLQTYAPGGDGLTIRGNYIHDNDAGILVKDAVVTGLRVENNLVVRTLGSAYALQIFNAPGAQVVNNTFWSRAPVIFRDAGNGAPADSVTVLNNAFESLSTELPSLITQEDYDLIAGGNMLATRGPHSFDAPPRFVAESRSDYRPAAGSPLIGAGTASGAPETDLQGRARVAGITTTVDVGALQAGGSTAGPLPAGFAPGAPVPGPQAPPAPSPTASPSPPGRDQPAGSTPPPASQGTAPRPATQTVTVKPSPKPSANTAGKRKVPVRGKRLKVSVRGVATTRGQVKIVVRCTLRCRVRGALAGPRARKAARASTAKYRRSHRINLRWRGLKRCRHSGHKCAARLVLTVTSRDGQRSRLKLRVRPARAATTRLRARATARRPTAKVSRLPVGGLADRA